jgi:ferrochelatase
MPEYSGLPEFRHGSTAQLGVLLVNLGTPDNPQPPAVRRFLAEFLWDPRVIESPRWLWWLILHGVILRIRPRRSSHAYQQIWTAEGSPLMLHSRELTRRLQQAFDSAQSDGTPGVRMELAMTYGSPSIRDALARLRDAGMRRLLVLPLYPQYSATTTASVFDRVTTELHRWRWIPELRFVNGYHDDPAYIAAITASIAQQWQLQGRKHLLFSFHGVPKRYLLAGDPYYCYCMATARRVGEQLGLNDQQWSISFQSQVGREEWLRPYTEEILPEFAAGKHRALTVVCPGFAADNLETLEEIQIRNRELFLSRGGESYDYIPALNASPAHVDLLANLIRRHIQGWPEATAVVPVDALARERALRAGASQ